MNKHSLLVVANRSQARIFEIDRSLKLTPWQTLENADGQSRNQDLVTDRPGRRSADAMAGSKDPVRHDTEMFAAEVSEVLDKARRRSELLTLDIIAEPAFLGMLRKKMHKATLEKLDKVIDKDVVDADETVLRDYLKQA